VNCPKCNSETFSDLTRYCSKCGRSLLRRPRAELVSPVRADRFQPSCGLAGSESLRFSNSGADARNTAEIVIETQWIRSEKVSFAWALFARLSEHFAKPTEQSSPEESAVENPSSASEPLQDRHPPDRRILVVNRAQVVMSDCAVCGDGFASTSVGERLFVAKVTEAVCYLFCANCGDQIISHVQSQEAAKHYGWDWAIPLRNEEAVRDLV
jgi:hypothetical protein